MVLTDDEGVSEVIGAILLVSLAVLGVAIVAVALFSQPAPSEIPQVSVVAGATAENTTFVLLHEGGDALSQGSYHIYVDTSSGLVDRTGNFTLAGDDVWSIGENLTYAGSDIAQIDRVVVSVVDSGGGETMIAEPGYSAGVVDAGGYVDEGGAGTVPSTSTLAPNFVANVTNGTAPLTVQFLGVSTGAPTAWLWDFGDYTTSTEQNVTTHTYAAAGTYTVSLTVSNGTHSGTETKTGYIVVSGSPTTWYDVILNTDGHKSGSLQTGDYLEFEVTGANSKVKIDNEKYDLNIGDTIRLTMGSDGYGDIYIGSGDLSTFSYDDVSLSINGEFEKTGTVKQIWINDYDDLHSTLTLQVPATYAWTQFTWNGETKIYGSDGSGIMLDDLMPGSDSILNLQNHENSGVYLTGSASAYTYL